ncbi:hypothetical protein CEXT_484201 [Caerostris extrusa]|uniref:Uncharacterized protein n=1 Tax=Caerostris extrusa TaxID=172846 RepID=A0AAV4NSU9_CAEEX|nr:hypothetical protein CEXT_484201 [Caerostris extrusa]
MDGKACICVRDAWVTGIKGHPLPNFNVPICFFFLMNPSRDGNGRAQTIIGGGYTLSEGAVFPIVVARPTWSRLWVLNKLG